MSSEDMQKFHEDPISSADMSQQMLGETYSNQKYPQYEHVCITI